MCSAFARCHRRSHRLHLLYLLHLPHRLHVAKRIKKSRPGFPNVATTLAAKAKGATISKKIGRPGGWSH
jgi:hypothetical protein